MRWTEEYNQTREKKWEEKEISAFCRWPKGYPHSDTVVKNWLSTCHTNWGSNSYVGAMSQWLPIKREYITNGHLLICDYRCYSSKGLRSKVCWRLQFETSFWRVSVAGITLFLSQKFLLCQHKFLLVFKM